MKVKNKLALALFLIGAGISVYALVTNDKDTSEQTGHLDKRNHSISPELIEKHVVSDDSYDALAIFVVGDDLCSSCINEIIEYTDAISNYTESTLNGLKILRHGLVVGDDATDYQQINHLVEFPFSSTLLHKESPLAEKIRKWKQDVSGMNQILLIDLERHEVVGRIGIFTSSTTPVFKKNLVQEAFYELENQANTN